jgi:hypothetical protein
MVVDSFGLPTELATVIDFSLHNFIILFIQ